MGDASGNSVLRIDQKLPFLSAPFSIGKNLYEYRQLLSHFVSRDMKVKYHNSILGYAWSVLEPLALTVTFYILFAILRCVRLSPIRNSHFCLGGLGGFFFLHILLFPAHRDESNM